MSAIKVTDITGALRSVEYETGASLMEVLREQGYEQILAMCGGCCSCATCHVHINNGGGPGLAVMEEDEQMLLEMTDNYHPELSRLSCQIELGDEHDGLEITIVEND